MSGKPSQWQAASIKKNIKLFQFGCSRRQIPQKVYRGLLSHCKRQCHVRKVCRKNNRNEVTLKLQEQFDNRNFPDTAMKNISFMDGWMQFYSCLFLNLSNCLLTILSITSSWRIPDFIIKNFIRLVKLSFYLPTNNFLLRTI